MKPKTCNDKCIDRTESVCPHCLQTIPATIYEDSGSVYMSKVCPEHGLSSVYLWPDVEQYLWFNSFKFPLKSREPQTEAINGCPRDCGLCPRHLRGITLAEIEVTWRCNQKCPICFMSAGKAIPPDPSLKTLEFMLQTIYYYEKGQATLQITGGEPTVRRDLPDIIRLAHQIGFNTIEINTNGLVLGQDLDFLQSLKEAGLTNIYLQFDGLSPETTRILRGEGLLEWKLKAIENCRNIGIPVILAPTIIKGINDGHLGSLIDYCMDNLDVVEGLAIQPAFISGRFELEMQKRLSLGDIAALIEKQTNGKIASRDFWPLSCIHPLCACSTYLIGEGKEFVPLTKGISKDDYKSHFNESSPQGSVFADILIDTHQGQNVPRGLTVLIMSYMDAWTLDLKRLQQCNLAVTVSDGRSLPFCAYHLTDTSGRRLYPLSR
ncbi:MAG: radical SAM protein, partial [Dehalococcoidales bacterium]|nr:radical SAM protein [Dehalococcoidales bacterium]